MSELTIPALVLEFQARSLYVQHLLQAEAGIKEYEADWLKNAGEVMRDATGKFAKKGATVDTAQPQAGVMPGTMQMPNLGQAQQMTWTAMDMLENGAEITSDLIQGLVQDPGFRQRAGLVAGLAGAKALEKILEKSKIDPRLEAKLNDFIAEATQKLADEYGDDKDPFAQAIRTSGKDELPPGVPFEKRMEYDLAKYQSYVEALKNPKKYDKKKELLGKAVKASIPVVAYLGLTLGPEVIIGLAMKESIEAILVSAAVGQAVSFGANKAMDKANIENQWVRAGIDLAVGIAAGGLLASNKHFKVLSKADQVAQKGKKVAETAIKNTEEGTFYDKLSKPVKEFMDSRAKDILDSVKPLQDIKPTGIKLPEMKDVGWLSKGQFFPNSVLAIPKELRSLPSDFAEKLLSTAANVKDTAIWLYYMTGARSGVKSLQKGVKNVKDTAVWLDGITGGYAARKYLKEGTNQVMSVVIDGAERKILIGKVQKKVSEKIDAAGEAIEDAFWWLLPKGMDALDASAKWADDVAKQLDNIYETKIKTFRPRVEEDIDNLKQTISQEMDSIALEIDSLKSMGSAFDWDGGLSESFNPQKAIDDITDSVQNLYKNKVQTIKPRIKQEMDELANHLSQEIDKLKMPDFSAKFKGKKAIADQWVKDVSESMETFYNSEIKNLKPNIEKEVKELQRIASQEIDNAKNKVKNYQKVTKQWSDDASKALKELYENEVKNFQPNLEKEMAGLKSLMSKQIKRFREQASLTAQNIDTWVDNVSATLKKLYQDKTKKFKDNIQSKINIIKSKFNKNQDINPSTNQDVNPPFKKRGKLPDNTYGKQPFIDQLNRMFGEGKHDAIGFDVKDQKFTAMSIEFDKYKDKEVFAFGFTVNNSEDMLDKTILSKSERGRSALKLRAIFNYFLSNMKEGSIIQATPYADDGYGEARTMMYQAFGFTMGSKNNMYAKVSNGKLQPIGIDELSDIDNKINLYTDYVK